MAGRGPGEELKRYGAPAAFLAAVTIAVLLVRAGLDTGSTSDTGTRGTPPPALTRTTATPARARPHRRYYRLRQGETISDVAVRFNTSVERLLVLNPGIEPNSLVVGRRIRVR